MAELSDFSLGFFLSGGSRKSLSHSLALNFVGHSRIRAMRRLAGLMTMTVGLAAPTAGIGNRPTAKIGEVGEFFNEFGPPGTPNPVEIRACKLASYILAYLIR